MSHTGSILFVYAETSLHAGSGTAVGAVDLPIQRERMSDLPLVQGSGIKGALREQLKDTLSTLEHESDPKDHLWLTLFGNEPPKAGAADPDPFAGAVSLTDARLLLFPVRTVVGGWAWATCPMILERLLRDLDTVGVPPPVWTVPVLEGEAARVGQRCTVLAKGALLIEDLEYAAEREPQVDALAAWLKDNALPSGAAAKSYSAFGDRLSGQLVVLPDTELKFLAQHATEVVTRIRIDPETGTVAKGALWSEESLPAETVLYSLALFSDGRRPPPKSKGKDPSEKEPPKRTSYKDGELREAIRSAVEKKSRIQLGGDRTTGRGVVALRTTQGGAR